MVLKGCLEMRIVDSSMSTRTKNALEKAGFRYVVEILRIGRTRLKRIRGLGRSGMNDIGKFLATWGLVVPELDLSSLGVQERKSLELALVDFKSEVKNGENNFVK